MPSGCTRRDLLLGSLSALAACTAHRTPAQREAAPAAAQAGREPLLITDGGSPLGGASTIITVYADGLVVRARWLGMGEQTPVGRALMTARADEATLARVRGLIARQDVLAARAAYSEPGVMDGGGTMFVAGPQPRRIMVINDPPDVPRGLIDLAAEARRLDEWIERDGVDAFTGQPALVLRHARWFTEGFHSDELMVFADGTLDFRVLSGDAVDPDPETDFPYPIVRTGRVDPAELGPLIAAVTALRAAEPTAPPRHAGAVTGTRHILDLEGLPPRLSWVPGAPIPPALERVLIETRLLRTQFDAAPDQALALEAAPSIP